MATEDLKLVRKEDGTYNLLSLDGKTLGVITDPAAAQAINYALMNITKPLRGKFLNTGSQVDPWMPIPELAIDSQEHSTPDFWDVITKRQGMKCIE